MEFMLMPYRRYADFSGRSRRKEYWMFALFQALVAVVIMVLMATQFPWSNPDSFGIDGPSPLMILFGGLLVVFWLGSLVPNIAVTVRRFHDQDKSGWMYLLNFVPYVGGLVVFVFMCLSGTRGPNQYGDDPLDGNMADVFA
ncbi:DUF805 domain-containing protein [Novosphingobium sp. FSY-8]|uniref:DUF805 domain-containing protein n=1 Tax=Novosphingobium ovatum TaxID=1908523 RepID=A0ABW9XED1_9SPHN|nr:DUF805 domain-containing protein [Novosphingobium ovatum]NBC36890.1 DUF805 domain-containing protein [Novosphingobium ovatum]